MAPWPQTSAMNRTKQEETTTTTDPLSDASDELPPEAAVLGAASKPKDDTLYEELLRYHEEEGDAETIVSSDRRASIGSEEDCKLPAKPSTHQQSEVRNRAFSEEAPSRLLEDQIVSNGTAATLRSNTNNDTRLSRSHGNSPSPLTNQEEEEEEETTSTIFGKTTKAAPAEQDVIPTFPEAPPASHYQQAYNHETMHPPIFSPSSSDESAPVLHHYDSSIPLGYATLSASHHNGSEESASSKPRRSPPLSHTPSQSPHSVSSHTPPVSKSSFYESALQASGQVSPLISQHDLAQDEKLARELSEKLELEDLARQQAAAAARTTTTTITPPDDEPVVTDPTQLEIMNKIRLEAERKQIEAALRESGVGGTAEYINHHNSHNVVAEEDTAMMDYLLSQQLAMEEWQHVPRPPMRRTSSEHRSASAGADVPYRVSMEHYTPRPPNNNNNHNGRPAPARRRSLTAPRATTSPTSHNDELLQRGSLETQEAIANGRAHVVQCQGCLGRLHAPMSYALVYCPQCHTVSPGQTYLARDDRSSLRRQRSTHGSKR